MLARPELVLELGNLDLGPDSVGELVGLAGPHGPVQVGDGTEQLGVLVDDFAVLFDVLLLDCMAIQCQCESLQKRGGGNAQASNVSSRAAFSKPAPPDSLEALLVVVVLLPPSGSGVVGVDMMLPPLCRRYRRRCRRGRGGAEVEGQLDRKTTSFAVGRAT